AVVDRGKAQPGDKTMVDALEPAARQASELRTFPLDQALVKVAEAAQQGVEATKTMLARVGKAKTLGERSRGHPDPGAVSTSLILQAMAEFVNSSSG
ncbi:MAG: DAK2 domain-containing protein, partial [Gemmataceae bacterium]